MKLVRYGDIGQEKPGMLDAQGRIRSLAGVVDDITQETVSPEGLARLKALDPGSLPLVDGMPRLGPPIAQPRQFWALGRNYALHIKEAGAEMPKHPTIFSKAITCISGATDDIPLYPGSVKLDYEGELAFVLGRRAHRIAEKDALGYIAGYCICNDVSEREWQVERTGTAPKGKSAPGYGPIGPWLVTADEVPDPQKLRVRTRVNGEVRQDASTADMIFPVARFLADLSEYMVLLPGDVLTTGTPEGVALGMKPPGWLKAGDVVQVDITGLGELRNTVVAAN